MAHQRKRHALEHICKLGSFWPVVGLLGLRQVGKTTLFRDILGLKNFVSFDDEEVLEDAKQSSKNLLSRLHTPVIIDEAQKVASIFDAIKFRVDQKKIPGQYYLTGSATFSSKGNIRESLTGRIGCLKLFPFTLAETHQIPFEKKRCSLFHSEMPRFKMDDVSQVLSSGGLPVPLFTRDLEQRKLYFNSWLDTTIMRDVARVYGKGYDPDVSWSILRQMKTILQNGEWINLRSFKQNSRILRKYLSSFEDIFLVQRIPCHEEGMGEDLWIFSDSGIARHLLESEIGQGPHLSLGRIFIFKEILANFEYAGLPIHPAYYKSRHGTPVDLIGENVAIKITVETKSGLSYEERSLAGAMKKLKLPYGLLVAPVDIMECPRKGITVVPWTFWS
ncbi:MAG: hypothetical protein A2Z91_00980 [Deltaproteobacteria bacterium GWA2_38_16]|nr:MAG: hypothetical protein A2Z91_00980 [Deltaproteobacteria bacterium GWA2_38_16]